MDCIGCLPVSRASEAAVALGVSDATLHRLVRDGSLTRLRQGVVVGTCLADAAATDQRATHKLRLRGQLLAYPGSVASHESGAVVAGLPLLTVPAAPRLTRARGAWRGGADGRVRIAPLPEEHVFAADDGLRATTMPRTAVDIGRTLPFRDAVVVMDAVLKHCPRTVVTAVVDECSIWAEVGKAGKALAFADPMSESALESVSRAEMHERGLPKPDTQVWVSGASGRRYRVDFLWRDRRLIGEADGAEKYADRESIMAEKQREDDLRAAGYLFVRWTYAEMVGHPDVTIAKIARALAR